MVETAATEVSGWVRDVKITLEYLNISTTTVLLSSLAIAVLLSSNNGGRKKYPEQPGRANSTNRLMSIGISSFTTTATARTKRPSELRTSHGNL